MSSQNGITGFNIALIDRPRSRRAFRQHIEEVGLLLVRNWA
jgi:hypothetical protein